MKLKVEIPASVVAKAYDRAENRSIYHANGDYAGTETVQRSFIPICVKSDEKGTSHYMDELNKMTKAQLIDFIEQNYSDASYNMEIIQ